MTFHEPVCGPSDGSIDRECRSGPNASAEMYERIALDSANLPEPYGSPHEHLADMLARHDLLLRRELVRYRARVPTDALGLAVVAGEEVEALLDQNHTVADSEERASKLSEVEEAIARLTRHIDRRVERSLACGQRLPIIELAYRFGLSALEIDIVITCLAAEVDRRYERIYGYLQDDMSRKQSSAGLALAITSNSLAQQIAGRATLNAVAPLRHFHIIEIAEDAGGAPWLARPMPIDERIVSFLLGHQAIDGRILPYVMRSEAGAGWPAPAGRHAELDNLVAQAVRSPPSGSDRPKPFVYLYGAGNTNAHAMVLATAQRLELPVISVEAEALCDPGVDFSQAIFLLLREALLSKAVLFLYEIGRVLDQDPGGMRCRALLRSFAEMGSIIFLSGDGPWRWTIPPAPAVLWPVKLHSAGFVEQFETWRAHTDASIPDSALHQLTSLHPMPPSAITATARLARNLANVDNIDGSNTIQHLQRACREQACFPRSGLARRIEPAHDWDDLVLPSIQLEQLRTICSHARHVSTVYGAWGFERKLSLGKGLNALFSGPPGTGKTLAASVIAADLGIELLSIDLSQIVSKYIGETEKNLRQLFNEAAAAHAILLFDEADALLGKRSAVKDAHDRYANTEVAYLLQKVEEYEGITILTTNLRQNMDEAFTRRMRFIVDFPLPEDADRLRIWKSVWPKEVPRDQDVDLERLARQFRLSGGSIRNVALAATFLAADEGAIVAMRHLMQAARSELLKIGRLVDDMTYPDALGASHVASTAAAQAGVTP